MIVTVYLKYMINLIPTELLRCTLNKYDKRKKAAIAEALGRRISNTKNLQSSCTFIGLVNYDM